MKLHREDYLEIRSRIKASACVLFRTKGFENTTVADLIMKLQIDEQMFYSYFRSMDELLEDVWSE